MTAVRIHVPVETHGLNAKRRAHWTKLMRWSKAERGATSVLLCVEDPPPLPVVVTMTRLFKTKPLDGDNLQGALKAIRDAVAQWLGVDDSDARIEWVYRQERGEISGDKIVVTKRGIRRVPTRKIGVIVEIATAPLT